MNGSGWGEERGRGSQHCFFPFSTSHASVPCTTALGRPTPRAERSHRGPCRAQVALCVLEVLPAPSLQPVAHSPVPPPPHLSLNVLQPLRNTCPSLTFTASFVLFCFFPPEIICLFIYTKHCFYQVRGGSKPSK